MITNPQTVARAIDNALLDAHHNGKIEINSEGILSPGLLFPFCLSKIIGMHTSKKGVDKGIWFRLDDSTVWNVFGEQETISNPDYYDTNSSSVGTILYL